MLLHSWNKLKERNITTVNVCMAMFVLLLQFKTQKLCLIYILTSLIPNVFPSWVFSTWRPKTVFQNMYSVSCHRGGAMTLIFPFSTFVNRINFNSEFYTKFDYIYIEYLLIFAEKIKIIGCFKTRWLSYTAYQTHRFCDNHKSVNRSIIWLTDWLILHIKEGSLV